MKVEVVTAVSGLGLGCGSFSLFVFLQELITASKKAKAANLLIAAI
jgi:hypothetical protein